MLADQIGFRLGEDAAKIVAGEGLQLHADRQAALQFGQQVRRLGDVEGARGDEQDVVRLHRPVLGGDGRPLDQGQEIALHALARDVRPGPIGARGDLVDLVDEHDSGVFGQVDGFGGDRVLVEQLIALLGDQRRPGGRDRGLVRLALVPERFPHDVGQIDHAHRRAGLAGNVEALQGRSGVGEIQFDLLVVQFAGAEFLAE